jgi:hypothetical protein
MTNQGFRAHRLARLLAAATDLREIARRIVADLQQQLDANVGSVRRPRCRRACTAARSRT